MAVEAAGRVFGGVGTVRLEQKLLQSFRKKNKSLRLSEKEWKTL